VSTELASSDIYPVLAVEYKCPCGSVACSHGVKAGQLPPGWTTATGRDGVTMQLCRSCSGSTPRDRRPGSADR